MFQGTFDVAAEKWIVTDARPINAEQDDALSSAYSDLEQDFEAVSLDETMNSVFRAVHTLPPRRFAAVKRGQIE
jgi:hypothetical protein